MVGLGLDASGPHLFGQAMDRGEDEGISLAEELSRSLVLPLSRHRLGSSSGASSAGRRGATRCWERGPFMCLLCKLYNQAWRGRLHVPRPYHAIGLGRPREGTPPEQTGNAHPAVALFHGYESLNA